MEELELLDEPESPELLDEPALSPPDEPEELELSLPDELELEVDEPEERLSVL